MKLIWRFNTVYVYKLTEMLVLKWIEKLMLNFRDVEDDVDIDVDDEIGSGHSK